MNSQQTAMLPTPAWRPLRSASAMWHHAIDTFRARREAARHERVVSKLSLHLRYDVGDIDCRPPLPPQLAEVLTPQQTTLESNWLRSFR